VLGAFFPSRWAMAALGTTVGLHGDKLGADNFSYVSTLFSTSSQAEAISHLFICWGVLALMIVLLACAIGWFMKMKDVQR
jgi:ABC transport system ATP-binding/permease protein